MKQTSYQTLVCASELDELNRSGQAPLLIDASFDLANTDAGQTAYKAAHLPGAHYLHLDRDLSGPKLDANGQFRGRHPLPDRTDFARRMSELGLSPGRQVVSYDAQGGMYAARLWWMLRWLGHANVAVLDGGQQAWLDAGLTLTDALPAVHAGNFKPTDSLVVSLSADELLPRLGQLRLIDARAPERFRGEVEPLDKKAGHIPGASNRLFKNNLQANGCFKPAQDLRADFEALIAPHDATNVIHQCGSGVTACHNLLAMAHAGLHGSMLYPGSWSEWSADPARPVAKG
ncbi:sulfurtransferase [Roseateles oligotrophus]|uniref:Sulfurtransferase n=1 Tax=Roseateles oligotrophus TaxID=1769250 RepID=A0ABT2YC48_9BURK|nr:sulfurtransferase [Roseateles oligotrophus]MCV2367612.1 sulfurtransferase [Roseateles oligotrophus]